MQNDEIRLGDFLFDPKTGELTRQGGGAPSTRLPPKPSALLTLLLSRRGEVLSREEIRDALWPDVEVDFEGGLNFCMRQVRAALGDPAAESRYIETLPRRGYRLRAEIEGDAARVAGDSIRQGPGDGPVRKPWTATGLILVLIALAATLAAAVRSGDADPVALAILPLHPADRQDHDAALIPELLLVRLGSLPVERLGVVGPTTTAEYGHGAENWRRMVRELGLDYLVGARFVVMDGKPLLLAELIRATDGAHVWVRAFEGEQNWSAVADVVGDAVLGELGLRHLEADLQTRFSPASPATMPPHDRSDRRSFARRGQLPNLGLAST